MIYTDNLTASGVPRGGLTHPNAMPCHLNRAVKYFITAVRMLRLCPAYPCSLELVMPLHNTHSKGCTNIASYIVKTCSCAEC